MRSDDEFMRRESEGVDFDPGAHDRLAALYLEEELHPGEEDIARARRLLAEAAPAVYDELLNLAFNAENPDVRQDARVFIRELHRALGKPNSGEK